MNKGTNDLLRRQNREARERAVVAARLQTLYNRAVATREAIWELADSEEMRVLDNAIALLRRLARDPEPRAPHEHTPQA